MTDDRRVDDLRQQLRSLGYLEAGVDRFVLAPAVRSRGPAAIALLASLRSGIVAAALLGPAAAVGLAGRLPGLVTRLQDAIVIAIYMAVLFGAAVMVLSFLAAVAVSAMSHDSAARGRALSAAAGIIVSLGCLGYLTLWWRTANAGFGWESPIWTAFALFVAVAISLLLGHVVTLTARAVLIARTAGGAQIPRVGGVSWKKAGAAGVLAFAGAASLLVLTAETSHGGVQTPLTVRSSGARVLVLAIDGFDANLRSYLHQGSDTWPAGLRGMLNGTRSELTPADSSDPARLWTTIATGRPPEIHGVQRLETRRVAGLQGRLTSDAVVRLLGGATDLLRLTRPATASNVERRVKTFWEVAAMAGFKTGVVNWWATWPADPSAGTVISDRAILRLEHGGNLDAELAPTELYDRLKAAWPALHSEARQRAESYFSQSDSRDLAAKSDTAQQLAPPERLLPALPADIKTVLTRSGELDAVIMKLAESIDTELDLLVVYLPGLDIAQHALLANDAPSPSAMDERISALRRYYGYLNSVVSDSIQKAATDGYRLIFVITQPGRLHQGPGIFAATGTSFDSSRTSGNVLDVAPTILHALGVPVARELNGRVVQELFDPRSLRDYPIRFVDTYGLKTSIPPSRGGGQPLDDEMIERLRSLGYVR